MEDIEEYGFNYRRAPRVVRQRTNLLLDDEHAEYQLFRMFENDIQELYDKLEYHLPAKSARYHAINKYDELKMTLRFLAEGSHYRAIADSFGLQESTLCRSIKKWIYVLADYLFVEEVAWPQANEFQQISLDFCGIRGIPNVVGLIDGTLVPIIAPSVDEDQYVDRHNNHSIQSQIICDANMRILDCYTNLPGSVTDACVLRRSPIYDLFQNQNYRPFDGSIILGDSAYPCLEWLWTPVLGNNLTEQQQQYNRMNTGTRFIVENTIGLLKIRYRTLLSPIRVRNTEYATKIIDASVSLHNYCLRQGIINENELEEANQHALQSARNNYSEYNENNNQALYTNARRRNIFIDQLTV